MEFASSELPSKPHIVIDSGSGTLKAGFVGQSRPTICFPALIGKHKRKCDNTTTGAFEIDSNVFLIGEQAIEHREKLVLQYPTTHGVITNWDDIERLWHFTFKRGLHVDPSEHNVMFTSSTQTSKAQKEKMTQLLFEGLEVGGTYLADQAVLSLYGCGLVSGVVLSSGDGITSVVPVYEGFIMDQAVVKQNIGGRDLTHLLQKLFQENGQTFGTSAGRDMLRELKERICFVNESIRIGSPIRKLVRTTHHHHHHHHPRCFDQSGLKIEEVCEPYGLPDGTVVQPNREILSAVPEALFSPLEWLGIEALGIHEMIVHSITNCAIDLRTDLYNCILLSGGNTMFPGLVNRLTAEIKACSGVPQSTQITILAPDNREITTWQGGAVLSELSSFQQHWITREQYEEFGPNIIHMQSFTS